MPSTKIDSPEVEPQPQVEKVETTPTKKSIEEKKVVEVEVEKEANGNVEEVTENVDDNGKKAEETDEVPANGNKDKEQVEKSESKEEKEEESEKTDDVVDGPKRKSISNEGDKTEETTPKKLKTDSEAVEKTEGDVTSSA